ncbi:MAG: lysophospholipid acyltransferase family protein [Bacillota bacterium]|jgi:1-acyl-sn-glycerol-3-phosphate acyltransferase|nr:1-acyl-sn-glycerol-3-phosphate acyltransferase [Bacillota bacterium]
MFYKFCWVVVRAFFCLIFRVSVVGLENVPEKGGAVIVANHLSYLDPPLIGAMLRRPIRFMAKKELFRFKPFAWLIRTLGAFPVDRGSVDRAAIREAIDTVSSGSLLGIFPEGGRSKDGRLQQGHAGAALVAIKTGVPVVPVGILGLGRNSAGQGLRRQIRLVIGEPLIPPPQTSDKLDRASLAIFTDDIMKAIADLIA